jgi:transglutaminase-like putative cysteine protease
MESEERMKRMKPALVFLFMLVAIFPATAVRAAVPEKIYYAVEIGGVVCGYSESSESTIQRDGKGFVQQDTKVFVMLSLLGSSFNSEINVKALLEAATRRLLQADTRIDQGGSKLTFELKVTDNEASLFSSLRGEIKKIALTPDVVIGSDELCLRLKKEFVEKKAAAASFDVLEMLEEEIQRSDFRKIGEENITLAGKAFAAVIVEGMNAKTGVRITYWLAPAIDYFVKYEVNNRKVYLADRQVVDRVKVANVDSAFFTKTNVSISDVQAISYMKLAGRIEPTGVVLKVEDLNVPGQKFSGTIKGNVIAGVFEIEHAKYDGHGAPLFPPRFQNDARLKKYLGAERFIETNDPVLVGMAQEISAGSGDSWQAAVRLSRWVAENIAYAIPGGGSARKAFDMRAGECGAHSMLLAAFCRAVGIPARVVFGAMYAPNFGGGFGQHAWNEIYMGPAGWIPVDATAFETDFVDSGHIRICELKSAAGNAFNGKEIRVLEHRLARAPGAAREEFAPFLGKFANLQGGRTFTVLEKEGNLALDVPGRMVLPFNLPDEKGRWLCKIAPQLYLVFRRDEKGAVKEMVLHQVLALPRKGAAQETGKDVPDDLAPYVGNYFFAAVNADLSVSVQDGRLAVYDPSDKTTTRLQPPGKDGGWPDEHGKVVIYFEKDGQGKVSGMKIDAADTFRRGELAAEIVEAVIQADGLAAGLKKIEKLKTGGNPEVLFSEPSFNQLGYRLLTAGKIAEAIEIFKLNVRSYPQSFNAFGSLGEAYMKNGQNELASENFKKSLQLNPKNENARRMLEKLGAH